jgi:riboflavin kinase/FMN adenylyltransferase
MNILEGIQGLKHAPPGSVMSIGNFDGLHRGHWHLLDIGRELRQRTPGSRLIVVTFEPHPLTVLRPQAVPPRLTTPQMKRKLLEEAGVDDLVILPPTRDVLNLTAEQFWNILVHDARPAHLVEGANFNFGKGRGGTIERLREWSRDSQILLHVIDEIEVALLDLQIVDVSSSVIRWLLAHGRVRDAAICLGRPYALDGEVVPGDARGRTIGVPTANLQCADQLVPADGVYAGRCTIDGACYPAAISIGTNPTFYGSRRQVEAHLLGFAGGLYGRALSLEFMDWVREQMRFPGVDALKSQIARDLAIVERLQTCEPARPIAVAAAVPA